MRTGKKKDLLRLREIYTRLVDLWEGDPDADYLSAELKLYYALRPDEYPIYRRKVVSAMPVKGLWWMNESQWLRFMWQGHQATVLKSGQDPDRVLATRSFMKGSFLYVREMEKEGQVDIEGLSRVVRWDPVKKKSKGGTAEWLTVSITLDSYKDLDSFLGPVDNGCKHEGPFA